MNNDNLVSIISLAKEFLGIVQSATIKDNEIETLIKTAIADMRRLAIDVDLTDDLHKYAIIQFVKGNFGMTNESTKQLCMNSYNLLVSSIQCNVDETED